ncbi:50S ribosomal protein L24P, partial [mine drainage metagenome]
FPITKGDIVKVRSGKKKGEGGKVSYVDHRSRGIQVEGINIAKADGKEKQFLINPEKLIITKLDITDARRLERIKEIATIKHKDITIIEKESRRADKGS